MIHQLCSQASSTSVTAEVQPVRGAAADVLQTGGRGTPSPADANTVVRMLYCLLVYGVRPTTRPQGSRITGGPIPDATRLYLSLLHHAA